MKTLKRRRKENKTDYRIRVGLLKSGKPRILFRKSNKYIIAQYVTSKEAQDRVVFGFTSKILLERGWPEAKKGSLNSLPAAYLTGLLFGKKIIEKKLANPVLDIGMTRNVNRSRIFAFQKGLVDAGVALKSKEEAFPPEERIKGKHLKEDFSGTFDKIKSEIESKK